MFWKRVKFGRAVDLRVTWIRANLAQSDQLAESLEGRRIGTGRVRPSRRKTPAATHSQIVQRISALQRRGSHMPNFLPNPLDTPPLRRANLQKSSQGTAPEKEPPGRGTRKKVFQASCQVDQGLL